MNAWLKPLTRATAGLALAGLTAAATFGADVEPKEGMVYVEMKTNMGTMLIELDEVHAPKSVENFMAYVEDEFYDGTVIHRVMPQFVIQGGGFDTEMTPKESRDPIENEWQNGLKNDRGTIAMARMTNPRNADGEYEPTPSATSQFYINLKDNDVLNAPRDGEAYAVFGRVVAGLETAEYIKQIPTGVNPKIRQPDCPRVPVVIETVREVEPEQLSEAADRAEASVERGKARLAEIAEELKRAAAGEWDAWRENIAKSVATEQAEITEKLESEEEQINKVLEPYGKTLADAKVSPTGLRYIDLKQGDGDPVSLQSAVQLHYTGWLANGNKFDSSRDRGQPIQLRITQFIKGWSEGVGAMQVGGQRLLIIPYQLAYGKAGRQSIPPEATLIFDAELLGVQ